MYKRRVTLLMMSAFLLILAAGCKKKAPPPPPPPAPAPAPPAANKPTINFFSAEPSSINAGQSSSLRWSVTDANDVQIAGIGQVSPSGRRSVNPTSTTTYHLTATGPGGTSEADANLTVASAPPPPPPANNPMTAAEMLAKQVQDIHFDYDKSDIRSEDQSILQADAAALKTILGMDSNFAVTIEGHCDERGSAEYNIGLGDKRAGAVRDALVGMGIPSDKLKTVSYGKERPVCTDASEDCYARNRRAHFSAGQ